MTRVSVLGLGYIGLPTAAILADEGHDVFGYDISSAVVDRIRDHDFPTPEPGIDEMVARTLETDRLTVDTEPVTADYHVVCVPTPFDDAERRADLTYVESATKDVAAKLEEGDTVILESTVPPGTTAEKVRPILEESGLVAGDDFSLAYSPETVLPGNILSELRGNDRIVGGISSDSVQSAIDLYETFVDGTLHTTNATTAEFAKLVQNTYRDVNIALANEFAMIAHDHDLDARDAIQLGNTHPRVDIHQPGPGVGGHCLPVDPWFLCQNSDRAELIELARDINDGMVDYVVEMLRSQLGELRDQKIAILGVAYKGNVSDIRQSPSLRLAEALDDFAIEVAFHDPHVDADVINLSSFDEATSGADALVLMTDHDEYFELAPGDVTDRMKNEVLIDTKGIVDPDEWTVSGFSVSQI